MLDDVLDVSGPVERTGKSRGQGPARRHGHAAASSWRASASRSWPAFDLSTLESPEQAEALCERIAATGALDEAREQALAVVAQAKAALPAILPDGRSALLDMVADAVVERYR